MTIDQLIKWATGLTVTAVATFAAIVSYGHLYELSHHQALLPLCVDGLMVAASLVLLSANRAKLPAPPLARVSLWLGIAATVSGNLAYGLPQGWLAAFVDAWPALALVLIVETLVQLAKSKRKTRVKISPTQSPQPLPKLAETKLIHKEIPQTKPVYATREAAPAKILPTIRQIRETLDCGQPIATDVQRIMRDKNVDIHKALLIRNEAKTSGRH